MNVDWLSILLPDTPVVEIIVRGSIMYLALFCFLRFVLHRQAGNLSLTDLLVITMMADAAQNGMAGDYHSVSDGIILVATLVGWNFGLEWLAYNFPWFERIIEAPCVMLVNKGRLLHRNMRREFITREDLVMRMHEEGLEDFAQVKRAYLEGDGKISVIKY
jgi:uncharacterized membrane protein YcaP (DUF421 family)